MTRAIICLVALLGVGCELGAHAKRVQLKAGDNPVAEVITLLEDLRTQTEDEGAAEAKTYEEFGCFCKDTTKEKSDAIKDDQTEIDTQTATLEEKNALAAEKRKKIAELNELIQTTINEMSAAETQRDKDRTHYEMVAADLEKAIVSVEGAVEAVHSHMPSSLVQVKAQLRASLAIADSLNLSPKHQRVLNVLLQDGEEDDGVPESDYGSHTGDLEETMDGLTTTYTDKKKEVDDQEAKDVEAHESYMSAKTSQKESAESDLADTTEDLNQAMEEAGEAETALSNANAKFKDDSTYLSELTAQCEYKAREWDQHSKMRADELTALNQALTVMTETVAEKDEKANKRAFVQQDQQQGDAAPEEMDDDQEEMDDDDEDLSFLQKSKRSTPARKVGSLLRRAQERHERKAVVTEHRAQDNVAKAKVVALLKAKNSPALTAMAMKVQADPFVKVKSLIQDLIAKMVKEAADEATQKGWCDTNLGKAKSTRDEEWSTVSKTNAQLEMLEAQRDQLSDDIDQLSAEIAEATDSLSKTTENRAAEKAENEETLQTAREGQAAVEEAIGILEKFYKGAKKGKVSLLQQGKAAASPVDEDFAKFSKKAGAAKGNQAASTGILGMMEVIKSDFERTIKVTTESEYGAARAFAKFDTATKASISSKETEKGQKEGTLQGTEAEIVDSFQDLESHQKMLDDVLKELEELNGQCIDTGMSYDDRVAKREEEIEALKEALCILDTDGVEDGC